VRGKSRQALFVALSLSAFSFPLSNFLVSAKLILAVFELFPFPSVKYILV
jgi:hypothetical protein